MTKIIRVGITLPEDLLRDLDETIARMGYHNRSKAIQDAIRSFLTEYHLMLEHKGTGAGVLVMVYDHEATGLEDDLIDIQHKYREVINSSLHVHLSERECLQSIAVRGDFSLIGKLTQELAIQRGVKQVKSVFAKTEQ